MVARWQPVGPLYLRCSSVAPPLHIRYTSVTHPLLQRAASYLAGTNGSPLIRMDPDDHFRFTISMMFFVLSVFPVIVAFPAATTARENAADRREQGDNAD